MSNPCETLESVAEATSDCPATDMIIVLVGEGSSTSEVSLGYTPYGVTVSTGNAASTVAGEAYLLLTSAAGATSTVSASSVVVAALVSKAVAKSTAIQFFGVTAASTANAVGSFVFLDVPLLLVSKANAVSTVTPSNRANMLSVSKAAGSSSAMLGLLESLVSTAGASSTVDPKRVLSLLLTSAGASTSTLTASNQPQLSLLISVAEALSAVTARLDATVLAVEVVEARSQTWFTDTTVKAWVMNTETTAGSWYDNFCFESVASVRGVEFAVGPDGIYQLSGDTDQGRGIDAEVVSGLHDFGAPQVKRLDNMYFGYTSAGQLAVKAEVYESGRPPSTNLLEQRAAAAPRNSRVTPGKGLWGRYWRLTISNVSGTSFEINDASVDLAVSPRRI